MVEYLVAGLVIGGIYAVIAGGLTVTYTASGVLNFGYGALAYFVARCYYFFHTQQGWSIWLAAVLSIVVIGPALGAVLYLTLFRLLGQASILLKVVVTIGLSVALGPISDVLFGNPAIPAAPGLAPQPVTTFQVFGAAVTMDQVIVLASVALILVGGTLIFKFTEGGLLVRAMVDSPAMTSLTGNSPKRISLCVWTGSVGIAGLVGVIVAPIVGLTSEEFTLLMATAFAALVVGEMVNLFRVVIAALLIGVATSLIQGYLPPQNPHPAGTKASADYLSAPRRDYMRSAGFLVPLVIVAVLALSLPTFWVGLLSEGVCFSIAFLAFTLVTGEGGMIWLCMSTFTGFGAVITAYLATNHGWPLLAAIAFSAVVVMPVGAILAFITSRMGGVYVTLVTLTFGLLIDNLFFARGTFQNFGSGIELATPQWIQNYRFQVFLFLGVFCVIAFGIEHLRRSTAGMSLAALRSSEIGARSLGLNAVALKAFIAACATFVAALGGALIAVQQSVGNPVFFSTLNGLVWFAIVATVGIRLNAGALNAGVSFIMIPALFATFLPGRVLEPPAFLFCLGAIMLGRNPDGIIAMQGRQIRSLMRRTVLPRREPPSVPVLGAPVEVEAVGAGASESDAVRSPELSKGLLLEPEKVKFA